MGPSDPILIDGLPATREQLSPFCVRKIHGVSDFFVRVPSSQPIGVSCKNLQQRRDEHVVGRDRHRARF